MESNEGWTKSQAETEAGLQRLEGQVLKVGSATDMATAAYVKNEVAQQNSKDLAAQSTALMAGPAVEAWGAITQATVTNQRATLDSAQAMSELKAARAANVITAQQYTDAMKDLGVHSGKQIADTESLAATTAMLDAAYAKTGTTFDSMSGKVISVDTGGITNASGELDALNGKTLDGKEIPVKTGPVEDSSVQGYQPPDKYATVHYSSWYDTGKPEAVGGAVYGGNPYTWQEYGYKGELFVPSTNGFVLSRADAERALAKALTGGGASSDPQAIGEAVAKALSGITTKKQAGNVYNLTMPTSSNPADVRTAFELMEAWA